MSYMAPYVIDGYKFTFSDSGIILDPGLNHLDEPEFLAALRTAYEVYDVINTANWLADYGSINLDGAPDSFFEEALEAIEKTEAQEVIVIWVELRAIINKIRRAYADRKNGTGNSSKTIFKKRIAKSGVVYLLQSGVFHKIGLTTQSVKKRVEQIQSAMPHEVHILHTIKSDDIEALETKLHKQFADSRVNGEWFTLCQEDVNYIRSLGGIS